MVSWREALRVLLEGEWAEVRDQTSWTPERFTSAVYQQVMAGKPRMAGARAALEQFGVPEVGTRAERYAAAKQAQVVELIQEGRFMAFPDALRFLLAAKAGGMAAIGVARLDDRDLLVEAGADLVVPTLDDVCRPAWPRVGWRSGRRPRSCDGGTPSGPRVSGAWSTTASTPPARGCARQADTPEPWFLTAAPALALLDIPARPARMTA